MRSADEKANTLSRCGSFYYRTLVEKAKSEAEFVSHISWNTRAFAQTQNIANAVTGGSYYNDFYKTIQFTDADINWFGTKAGLQVRTGPFEALNSSGDPVTVDVPVNRYDTIEVNDYSAVATTQNEVVTDEESDAILVPVAGSTVVLPATAELRWALTIDENTLVTSIKKSDGSIMYMNQDYIAAYGKLTFLENPISLFPSMQFTALSYTVRRPNIYNHMLNLGGVIGPVDRVLTYYRTTQTPKAFYLAACQACGLAVVPATCSVLEAYPLQEGWAYVTTAGRLDAPYPHYKLAINTVLQKDTVIGGNELFQLIKPEDALPASVESIELGTAVPIPGLSAPNSDIVITDSAGNVAPAYEGTPEAQQAWFDYVTSFASEQPGPGGSSITYRPSGVTTLAEAAAAAAVECDYQYGEAFSLYMTLGNNTAPSSVATSNLVKLAPDYYLITQAGQYIGLSASPSAMRNAEGRDPGWAPLTSTEDSWGITLNTMASDSRIYGWISRNAQGNTGTANVLPLNGLIIKITTGYKSNNYGTTITLTPANGTVEEEVICRDANPLNLTQMATNTNVTREVSIAYITVVNSMVNPTSQNGIAYFRNVACKGRCIVACINKGVMPKSMQLQLLRFIQRELPVGSVLTTADMPVTISNEETLDV